MSPVAPLNSDGSTLPVASTIAPIEFVAPDSKSTFPCMSRTAKSRKARRKLTPLGKRWPVRFVTVTSAVSCGTPFTSSSFGLPTATVAVSFAACSAKLRIANGIPLVGSMPLQPLDM
jgi:hypothetical protein